MIIWFIITQIFDIILTFIGVKYLNITEGNIIYNSLFKINIWLGLLIKLILSIICIFIINKFFSNLWIIINIIFTIIIIWNLILIIIKLTQGEN